MGLKDKLGKFKNFLFDDVDDEKEKKVLKKKKKKEEEEFDEIETPIEEDADLDDFKIEEIEDDIPEEPIVSEHTSFAEEEKTEETATDDFDDEIQTFDYKTYDEYDDDDFIVKSRDEIPSIITEEKRELYQGSKIKKEGEKKFKPSPIISPVYGFLDEQGNQISKDREMPDEKDSNDIDEVMKKAYGLKEEIKRELKEEIKNDSYSKEEEKEEDTPVEEEEKDYEVSNEKLPEEKDYENEEKEEDDDDIILPNVNFKEIDVDLERSKKNSKKSKKDEKKSEEETDSDEDDDEETKEQDLFNLIDTMYKEEGEE